MTSGNDTFNLAILLVNRQIHHEALSIYYATNNFKTEWTYYHNSGWDDLRAKLRREHGLSPPRMSFIATLKLKFEFDDWLDYAENIHVLLESLSGLRFLKLQ